MDPKVRYRTYDELRIRKKEFLKICNNKYKTKFKRIIYELWKLIKKYLST